MNQSNSSKQVLLSVIGVAILVVAVVGVSFAFFNYTRTGAVNTVSTGTIYFNTSESKVDVTNLFPVVKSTATSKTVSTDSVAFVSTITVDGYTTFADGVDYVVTAENVDFNTQLAESNIVVPFSVYVDSEGLGDQTVIDAYQLATGAIEETALNPAYGTTTNVKVVRYEVNPTAYVSEQSKNNEFTGLVDGAILAKGHIAPVAGVTAGSAVSNSTGRTHGTIRVVVYIDNTKVAISDTYPAEEVSANGYNGTTTTWAAGRTVLTTAQWNSLQASAASFRIKVVANQTGSTYTVANPYVS